MGCEMHQLNSVKKAKIILRIVPIKESAYLIRLRFIANNVVVELLLENRIIHQEDPKC